MKKGQTHLIAHFFIGLILLFATGAKAEATQTSSVPILVGLCNPVQTSPDTENVHGLGIGVLWDTYQNLRGVNLALGASFIEGDMCGVQFAFCFNRTQKGGIGVMSAYGFNGTADAFYGAQTAVGANICESDLFGFQYACSNYASSLHGVQLGVLNMSHDVHGLQVGIVNTAENLQGIQIGFLNFIKNSPYLKGFPIANAWF